MTDEERVKRELSMGKRAVSITSGLTTGTPVKRFDMSTPIEKIDVEELSKALRHRNYVAIELLAEKINELVDFCNNKAIVLNLCKHEYYVKDEAKCTKCGEVRVFPLYNSG